MITADPNLAITHHIRWSCWTRDGRLTSGNPIDLSAPDHSHRQGPGLERYHHTGNPLLWRYFPDSWDDVAEAFHELERAPRTWLLNHGQSPFIQYVPPGAGATIYQASAGPDDPVLVDEVWVLRRIGIAIDCPDRDAHYLRGDRNVRDLAIQFSGLVDQVAGTIRERWRDDEQMARFMDWRTSL